MGCDIHAFIEVKFNGKWQFFGTWGIDRNYELFAKMANVRNSNNVEPLQDRRGRPDDINPLTNYLMDNGSCDHSDGYLTKEELSILFNWCKNHEDRIRLSNYELEDVIEEANHNIASIFGGEERIQDVRLIFSFDN
jgi:hypothetical protein